MGTSLCNYDCLLFSLLLKFLLLFLFANCLKLCTVFYFPFWLINVKMNCSFSWNSKKHLFRMLRTSDATDVAICCYESQSSPKVAWLAFCFCPNNRNNGVYHCYMEFFSHINCKLVFDIFAVFTLKYQILTFSWINFSEPVYVHWHVELINHSQTFFTFNSAI